MNLSRFEKAVRKHTLSKIIFSCFLLILTSSGMAAKVKDLKVETLSDRSGCFVNATVKEMDNKVYVSGRVRINLLYQPSAGRHVDVYFVDAKGRTLKRKKKRIIVTSQKRDRTQGGQFPYAVGIDKPIASKAVTVRVVYCSDAHNDQS